MTFTFTRKRILISWETPYNYVVYNQIMIRNWKTLKEYSYCVITHTILQEKNLFFLHTKPLKYETHAFQKRNV
jgi:hypothetical protein